MAAREELTEEALAVAGRLEDEAAEEALLLGREETPLLLADDTALLPDLEALEAAELAPAATEEATLEAPMTPGTDETALEATNADW